MKFCFSCGTVDPEYEVEGYTRYCNCGAPCVITLEEAIDYLNQRYIYYGESPITEDNIDEEYSEPPIDLDNYTYTQDYEDDEDEL